MEFMTVLIIITCERSINIAPDGENNQAEELRISGKGEHRKRGQVIAAVTKMMNVNV